MRGKHTEEYKQATSERIIPAHAGQTWSRWSAIHCGSDHPRACGANLRLINLQSEKTGSSPRMRGKLERESLFPDHGRIIPAHAGQTFVSFADAVVFLGSSPRMRGKLATSCSLRYWRRIIPAHAGQTIRRNGGASSSPDHPRACGANRSHTASSNLPAGSSPRMRGKRRDMRAILSAICVVAARIIPAHAGQTV